MRISKDIQTLLLNGLVLATINISSQAFALQPESQNVSPIQNWDSRFTVVTELKNEAVRDNKTGLIWERSPRLDMEDWNSAHKRCLASNTGGRKDWRVPTVQELNSLIEPSSMEIKLPDGHPFTNVEPAIYWSATKAPKNATYAMFVNFSSGGTATLEQQMSTFVWCVRDAMKD
jgi:phage baseplate assembly protein gpV